jgi:hypothetical protein
MRNSSRDRVGLMILLLATLIGVWLGLAGPDASPVAPGGMPVQLVAVLGGAVGAVGP